MRGRSPTAAAAAAVMWFIAGCGSSATSSTTAPAAPTAAAPTAAAPTAAVAPTTTTLNLIPQLSPAVAATALLRAWAAGDRAAASRVATPAALATLFARPAQPFSDRGCQEPLAGASTCSFAVGDGLLAIHTVTVAGGWLVDNVTFE